MCVSKKFIYQMALVAFGILLVVILFLAAVFNMIRERKNTITDTETQGYEYIFDEENNSQENVEETESETVPNFGTTILNFERYVVPLLEDNSYKLEEALSEFVPEIETAEIFYVAVLEDDKDKISFFVKIPDEERVAVLTYSWSEQTMKTEWSKYTEDEIFAEVWNGRAPEYRDEEE